MGVDNGVMPCVHHCGALPIHPSPNLIPKVLAFDRTHFIFSLLSEAVQYTIESLGKKSQNCKGEIKVILNTTQKIDMLNTWLYFLSFFCMTIMKSYTLISAFLNSIRS